MLFEVLSNKLTWFAEAPKYAPFCALQLFTVPCLEEPANKTKQSLKPLPLSNAASVPLVSPGIVIVFFSQVLESLIVYSAKYSLLASCLNSCTVAVPVFVDLIQNCKVHL